MRSGRNPAARGRGRAAQSFWPAAARIGGLSLLAACAAAAAGSADAQIQVSTNAERVVVGDLAGDGPLLQLSCDGPQLQAYVVSLGDLENAYSRALGQPGRVPRTRFETGADGRFFALQRLTEADPDLIRVFPTEGPRYVYRLDWPGGGGEAAGDGGPASALADMLSGAAVLRIGRSQPLDVRGLGPALTGLEAICPL